MHHKLHDYFSSYLQLRSKSDLSIFVQENKAIQTKYFSELGKKKLYDTIQYVNVSLEFLTCKQQFFTGNKMNLKFFTGRLKCGDNLFEYFMRIYNMRQ